MVHKLQNCQFISKHLDVVFYALLRHGLDSKLLLKIAELLYSHFDTAKATLTESSFELEMIGNI
jgi:hypothetical protein